MAKVERKTKITIEMEVVGYDGKKRGHLEFTSGNIYYYRLNGKQPAAQYTYQQLMDLMESEIQAAETTGK